MVCLVGWLLLVMSSLKAFRRSSLPYYIFLTVVLFIAYKNFLSMRHAYFDSRNYHTVSASRPVGHASGQTPASAHGKTIRPGDIPAPIYLERFQEPEIPVFEPAGGIGSARDVRYVAVTRPATSSI